MDTVKIARLDQLQARLQHINPFSVEGEAAIAEVDALRTALNLPPLRWEQFWPQPERRSTPPNVISKPDVRADVWDKTAGKCWYCGKQTTPWRDFCVDHLLARTKGGSDELTNLVPCCRPCNTLKGNRPLPRFRQLLANTAGPAFTAAQIAYLREHGIEIPQDPGEYQFYFERIGGGQS